MDDYSKQMQKHIRKKKLREARRKAGPRTEMKKPRLKKLSPTNWDDADEFGSVEVIMPKGDRERRREIEQNLLEGRSNESSSAETDPVEIKSNPIMYPENSAMVIEVSSRMCRVEHGKDVLLCSLRDASLDTQETGYTNVIAIGDQVMISRTGNGQGVVEAILPRRSVLSRPFSPDVGKVHEELEQIVVANVDRLLIVASWREPYIWPAMIDRYLIAAARNDIEAVICINKIDLIEDQNEFKSILDTYRSLEHRVILTSAVTGEGIDNLREVLSQSTSVLAGLSGVGKSTLLTAVQPDLDLKIGRVSEKGLFTGQGRHTTTQSSLWKLENGGIVIDTPGVRTFGLAGIAPKDLSSWYPEISIHSGCCRFSNCSHIYEPKCAVKEAVENGEISDIRYKNYNQIFEELSGSR